MRLDVALVERGLARSRSQAAELLRAGKVRVAGEVVTRASCQVDHLTPLEAETDPYVSRAAHKLIGALEDSGTPVGGRVLDAGASTGGFTQVCLERGAHQVLAFDVGHGQLHPTLRADSRVEVREGFNLRHLQPHDVGEPVDMITGDVSFISLRLLLGPLHAVIRPGGVALLLVKPQFELGREALDSHGVVRDPSAVEAAVDQVVRSAAEVGWRCDWTGDSRLPGADGNREVFVRLLG